MSVFGCFVSFLEIGFYFGHFVIFFPHVVAICGTFISVYGCFLSFLSFCVCCGQYVSFCYSFLGLFVVVVCLHLIVFCLFSYFFNSTLQLSNKKSILTTECVDVVSEHCVCCVYPDCVGAELERCVSCLGSSAAGWSSWL